MPAVHHLALAALRFGLVLDQGARHKCPHTRSPPGQRGCISSRGEHLCFRCVCFNYVVAHVVYSLYLTLKTESNILTSLLPKPKQCNPPCSTHRKKQSCEGRKNCCTERCSAALQILNSPQSWAFTHNICSLVSHSNSLCSSWCPALSQPGRAGDTLHTLHRSETLFLQ